MLHTMKLRIEPFEKIKNNIKRISETAFDNLEWSKY